MKPKRKLQAPTPLRTRIKKGKRKGLSKIDKGQQAGECYISLSRRLIEKSRRREATRVWSHVGEGHIN